MTGDAKDVGAGALVDVVAALDERRLAATVAADLQALDELLCGHFQREHGHSLLVFDGGVLGNIHGE